MAIVEDERVELQHDAPMRRKIAGEPRSHASRPGRGDELRDMSTYWRIGRHDQTIERVQRLDQRAGDRLAGLFYANTVIERHAQRPAGLDDDVGGRIRLCRRRCLAPGDGAHNEREQGRSARYHSCPPILVFALRRRTPRLLRSASQPASCG